ncbi:hypothetical protein LOY34_26545 [Pseudomonas sp. B21-009]|uniref:hypothetical protein n=1 Tax=Pseudomonas sp. B21-009 TaxID=2895470 RepID=UPI00216008C2|nr:hypothetical protein [Pseudomonas sp. B21-009]UVM66800.1 hypothetical protein LOY34_26545 [Pseudomonas sp. B21-009]
MTEAVKRCSFAYRRPDLRNPDSKTQNWEEDYIVWWYGPVMRNNRAMSIPLVTVIFRRLLDNVPGDFKVAHLPLTSLPHYRVGSIWRGGRCISDTELVTERLPVNFSAGKCQVTSRRDLIANRQERLFSDAEYPLLYQNNDRCKLLNFPLGDGKKNLLIPCTEYFVRAYARNMEVCRVLANLSWSDVLTILFESPEAERDLPVWLIRPGPRMRLFDAVFLAHILYDPHTTSVVRKVNSQFMSSAPGESVLLECRPWFEGPGEILGRGRWLNGGETFLCLDLMGTNLPKGPEVEFQKLKYDSSEGEDGMGRTVLPRPIKSVAAEEFLQERSTIEPDGHAEIYEAKAASFKVLGERRPVKKTKSIVKANKGRLGPAPPEADGVSAGTGTGSGKHVGKLETISDAEQETPPDVELETQGFLMDIWNALKSIAADNPEKILRVDWYTPVARFSSKPPLNVVELAVENEEDLDSKVRSWLYLDRSTGLRRGILIVRIKTIRGNYFCFEVQRKDEKVGEMPPGSAGLLMKFSGDEEAFKKFVTELCRKILGYRGVFGKLKKLYPEEYVTFKHGKGDKKILYRNILINKFSELGIELS